MDARRSYLGNVGQVLNVYGSPGPASGITIDAVFGLDEVGSNQVFRDIHPAFLPDEFDIIIRPGAKAMVVWISETEGVWSCEWIPMTTDCV